jgi:hypothetical protein
MDKFQKIEKEIKDYLFEGNVFNFILKNNLFFFKDELELFFKNENLESIQDKGLYFCFLCNPSFIIIKGKPIIQEIKNNQNYEYLYITDFEYNGFISQSDELKHEVHLNATLKILTSRFIPNYNVHIQLISPIINLLDRNATEIFEYKDRDKRIPEILREYIFI